MNLMTENGFEETNGKINRVFDSEEYESRREFFPNGIVDGGYGKIQFDFSECMLDNGVILNPKELLEEPVEILTEIEEEDVITFLE